MILAAMAACIAFIVYAGTRIYGTIGPSRGAVAADGSLYLASHGKLHVFGTDGKRTHAIDLEKIGAPPRPSDFDLHRDGRVVLVDPDHPELVRCSLPSGPCERVPVSIASLPAQEVLPLNAAKIFVDDAGGRYFISDNTGHRVLATTHEGRTLSETRADIVRHPNRLALVAPDRLDVVDTDRSRIVTFAVNEQGVGAMIGTRSTRSRLARPLRYLPFDAERLPDGSTAVLVAANGMKDADLLLFDPRGKPFTRAELGADSDPFDIVPWRDRLWVADATRYRFDAVNFDASVAAPLEDADFIAELAREREEPQLWKERRRAAQLGLVGIPLLGALLLWKLGDHGDTARRSMPKRQAPGGVAIQWVTPRRVFLRRMKVTWLGVSWLTLLYAVCAIAYVVLHVPVFTWGGLRTYVPMLGLTFFIALLVFVTYRVTARAFEGLRLGASADTLRYEIPRTPFKLREGAVPWSQVWHDGKRRLLVGTNLLLLWQPIGGAVFDEAELRSVVLDRIPRANVVDPRTFMKVAWPALRKPILLGVAAGMAVLLIQLAFKGRLL
jgi:hypothetical protein